jgi:hypothetical protein
VEICIHLLDLQPGTEAKNAAILGPWQELNLQPCDSGVKNLDPMREL